MFLKLLLVLKDALLLLSAVTAGKEQRKGSEGHPWHNLWVFGMGQDLENLCSDSWFVSFGDTG